LAGVYTHTVATTTLLTGVATTIRIAISVCLC
jgi:hypothetical protein